MRNLARLLTLGFLLAASTSIASTAGARHVVFLIHGIAGDPSHFGHMKEALTHHLNARAKDHTLYEVTNFAYDTKSDTKDTYEFARDLGREIDHYFDGHIGPDDRISFVMHSQGGLVGSIWMMRALEGNPEYHPEYFKHLDAFVTLATPFWGSKIATFTTALKNVSRGLKMPRVLPGRTQLHEMSFGSETIHRFRETAQKVDQSFGLLAALRLVRPLNIAGTTKWMNPLHHFAIGDGRYEDDSAVILPSARLDFYYQQTVARDGQLRSEFHRTQFSPFMAVNAIHLSPVVDFPQMSRGIAQVQSDCILNFDCDHPTFSTVARQILGEPVKADTELTGRMGSFLLDIDVQLKGDAHVDPDHIQISFEDLPSGVQIGKPIEFYSRGESHVVEDSRHARFFYTGAAKDHFNPQNVKIRIESPGYRPRVIEARVRSTFSTYVETELQYE